MRIPFAKTAERKPRKGKGKEVRFCHQRDENLNSHLDKEAAGTCPSLSPFPHPRPPASRYNPELTDSHAGTWCDVRMCPAGVSFAG